MYAIFAIFSSSLPCLHTSNTAVTISIEIYNILKWGKVTQCGGGSRFSLVARYALNKATSFVSFEVCHSVTFPVIYLLLPNIERNNSTYTTIFTFLVIRTSVLTVFSCNEALASWFPCFDASQTVCILQLRFFEFTGRCPDASVTDTATEFSMSLMEWQMAMLSFPIYTKIILCDTFIRVLCTKLIKWAYNAVVPLRSSEHFMSETIQHISMIFQIVKGGIKFEEWILL
jgi:hypothetical protein